MRFYIIILMFACLAFTARAQEKTIRVFVALCDNATQGIAPVPAKIGNGDNPRENLYWGCDEGLYSYFKRSPKWTVLRHETGLSTATLERLVLRHTGADITLMADAYRGSAIRACLADFEKCAASGSFDLVAYIGHNGLMDFDLAETAPAAASKTDAIVLCCQSNRFFVDRLRRLRARPILLTDQFMYPGSFILYAAIESWREGGSLAEIRNAAGRAYAANQKISLQAATGVFARLVDD